MTRIPYRLMKYYRRHNKRDRDMALTCDFKETVKARVQRDPAFRDELIKEAIRCIRAGNVDTGKVVMRDYINAMKPGTRG